MKINKIANWIYSNPQNESTEILVRALHLPKEDFLDFLWNETLDDYSLKFAHFILGHEVTQIDAEKLWEGINTNRENIISEYNKLFKK